MLTLIARVRDGLPLSTSIEGDEQHDHNMVKYTNQAKMLFRKLHSSPPVDQTVESGPYYFHYVIRQGICCLCLCEKSFSRKSAFAFLEDVANEFNSQNGNRVDGVTRPYHFIEFDQYIQQAKRKYGDRQRYAMSAVNNELQDVTRIMITNIEDVIHRGEALNILDDRAAQLKDMSTKYRDDAKQLNRRSAMFKIIVAVCVIGFFLLVGRFFIW